MPKLYELIDETTGKTMAAFCRNQDAIQNRMLVLDHLTTADKMALTGLSVWCKETQHACGIRRGELDALLDHTPEFFRDRERVDRYYLISKDEMAILKSGVPQLTIRALARAN